MCLNKLVKSWLDWSRSLARRRGCGVLRERGLTKPGRLAKKTRTNTLGPSGPFFSNTARLHLPPIRTTVGVRRGIDDATAANRAGSFAISAATCRASSRQRKA